MFRYIAFSWDARHSSHTSAADRLDKAFYPISHWQAALRIPGLRVYSLGREPGVNDAYTLPSNKGVILGKLFRKKGRNPPPQRSLTLSTQESDDIFASQGESLIDSFWGRYVAFLMSPAGEPKVLNGPSGFIPCYKINVNEVTIIFSWLEDLFDYLSVPLPLSANWQAITAHMLLGGLGGNDTALEEIQQILPGELSSILPERRESNILWSPAAIARNPIEPDLHAAERLLRETVMECAQEWAACYESILLRLSGGVDSAILLSSICASYSSSRVTCLNYYSTGSDSDERRFARRAAGHVGATLIEQERDKDYNLQDILDAARMPIPPNYVGRMGSARTDAQIAASLGAPAMFSGAGGDQVFFELLCTWPAADYLHLHGLDRGFLRAALDSAQLGRVSLWMALKKSIVDQSYSAGLSDGVGRYLKLIKPDAVEAAATQSHRHIHPHLRESTGIPIGKFNQVRWVSQPVDYFDPYLREAAPEMVNPLLSQPIIEVCLAMPTYLLTRGGRGRALARNAFSDHIPQEIVTRRSKGGMEEHVTRILHRNIDLARGLLMDGQLASRGLIDRKQVEASLFGNVSTVNAAYVSEIHGCLAVEAWLQQLSSNPKSALVSAS